MKQQGIIIVDKPEGMSSHTVISRLRRILPTKRVGHGGTLDPMATGVLVCAFGRAARVLEYASGENKRYTAGFRLGLTTDTQDITGRVLSEGSPPSMEALAGVLPRFTGQIVQLPPMYSAIKVDGRKLYEIARNGEEIERRPREIQIFELVLLEYDEQSGEGRIDVCCSKGTYIRTICHDIGQALSCGGVMTSLRRTSSGEFTLCDAHTLEELFALAEDGRLDEVILPASRLFSGLPILEVNPKEEKRLRRGATVTVSWQEEYENQDIAVYFEEKVFAGLGRAQKTGARGRLCLYKGFFDV